MLKQSIFFAKFNQILKHYYVFSEISNEKKPNRTLLLIWVSYVWESVRIQHQENLSFDAAGFNLKQISLGFLGLSFQNIDIKAG
jgi:hypothetical protein